MGQERKGRGEEGKKKGERNKSGKVNWKLSLDYLSPASGSHRGEHISRGPGVVIPFHPIPSINLQKIDRDGSSTQ